MHALQAPSAEAREGGQATLLGAFAGWNVTRTPSLVAPDADLRTPRALMHYEGGEACWEGPERSARVELRCRAKVARLRTDAREQLKLRQRYQLWLQLHQRRNRLQWSPLRRVELRGFGASVADCEAEP